MSAQLPLQQVKFPGFFGRHRPIPGGAWQVATSVIVNADRQRIFQALTVPEYIEAWLRSPGDRQLQVSVSRDTNGYRIEFKGAPGNGISFIGTYVVFRRSKIVFTWQKEAAADAPPGLVLIRLHGEFSRTRLCLYHFGLRSQEEHLWHRNMWEASLEGLSCLFTQGASGLFSSPARFVRTSGYSS